jgi:hypothetical protein
MNMKKMTKFLAAVLQTVPDRLVSQAHTGNDIDCPLQRQRAVGHAIERFGYLAKNTPVVEDRTAVAAPQPQQALGQLHLFGAGQEWDRSHLLEIECHPIAGSGLRLGYRGLCAGKQVVFRALLGTRHVREPFSLERTIWMAINHG